MLGFDPVGRIWVTAASGANLVAPPPLDGMLLTDPASLTAVADDFGHVVHCQPVAVLKPGSIDDIVQMVRFARQQGLKIGGRGQGHTVFGQSQVEAGVVIDMSTLNKPPIIAADRAQVRAGVPWRTLLEATLAAGLTPPVLTDYLGLSVGGTLSVGGVSGSSHHYGAQVDNVLELLVVTGEGRIVACSADQQSDLFEAVLAGLGQCAIIVQATVKLIPARTNVRLFRLVYPDLPSMIHDERLLIGDGRFNHVEGFTIPFSAGGPQFFLEATSYYTPPAAPANAALLAGLGYIPGSEQIEEKTYFEFADRVTPQIEALMPNGRLGLPHPWFDVFVPGSAADRYIGGILSTLTPADLGPDFPILLYPLRTDRFTRPLFRVPDEPVAFLFDILRTAPDDDVATRMIARNRILFERVRDLGGKHYTISAIPLSEKDWKEHFQPFWGRIRSAKSRYDPDNVLTPGPGIF